jgi:hypothetical protein
LTSNSNSKSSIKGKTKNLNRKNGGGKSGNKKYEEDFNLDKYDMYNYNNDYYQSNENTTSNSNIK